MKYCCAPRCGSNSYKSKGIFFHEFPSNLYIRSEWLNAISRPYFIPDGRYDTICSKHFRAVDYKLHTKKKCLQPNSIPSIFSNDTVVFSAETEERNLLDPCSSHTSKKLKIKYEMDIPELQNIPNDLVVTKLSPLRKDVEAKIKLTEARNSELSLEVKKLREKLLLKDKTISLLKNKLYETSKRLNVYEKNVCFSNVKEIQEVENLVTIDAD